MTTKDQIGESQRAILYSLARHEDGISELYASFASRLPSHESFWLHLSKEEQGHGRLLMGLEKVLERGFLFYEIGRFKIDVINAKIGEMATICGVVRSSGITPLDAASIACEIESGMIDSQFFKVVTSDAPEFKHVAGALTKATEKHSMQVRELLQSLKPPVVVRHPRK